MGNLSEAALERLAGSMEKVLGEHARVTERGLKLDDLLVRVSADLGLRLTKPDLRRARAWANDHGIVIVADIQRDEKYPDRQFEWHGARTATLAMLTAETARAINEGYQISVRHAAIARQNRKFAKHAKESEARAIQVGACQDKTAEEVLADIARRAA